MVNRSHTDADREALYISMPVGICRLDATLSCSSLAFTKWNTLGRCCTWREHPDSWGESSRMLRAASSVLRSRQRRQAPIFPLRCLYLLCFPQSPRVSRHTVTQETFLFERSLPSQKWRFAFYPNPHLRLKESSSCGQWASSYLFIQTSAAD